MKKVKIAISILVILSIIGIVVFFLEFQKSEDENEMNDIIQDEMLEEQVEVDVVENTAMYFTVESCIDKYISYIQDAEKTAVYKIIDLSYLNENNIIEDNVLDNIESIPEGSDFDIQKMLIVKNEEEDLQKYYVYGLLRYNNGQTINKQKMYLTVNIDLENMMFSIIPNVPDEGVFHE